MAASMAASMLFFVFITGGASQETCPADAFCESTISTILLQSGVTWTEKEDAADRLVASAKGIGSDPVKYLEQALEKARAAEVQRNAEDTDSVAGKQETVVSLLQSEKLDPLLRAGKEDMDSVAGKNGVQSEKLDPLRAGKENMDSVEGKNGVQSEKLDPLRAGKEDNHSVAGKNGGGLSSGERFESVVTETKEDVLHPWKSSYKATMDVLHTWKKPLSASVVITTVARDVMQLRVARDAMRCEGYPYFSVLAGATQWCLYGFAATYYSGEHSFLTLVAANGLGMLFAVFYIMNFFNFVAFEDIRCRALRSYLLVGLILLILQAVAVASMHERAMFWLGLLGSIGSAQIALSPFKTLPEVLKTRSTRSWPLELCVWNFVQSFFTGSFGLSNNDPWVWIPNVVGVIAAMVQLGLIAKFWEPWVKTHAPWVKTCLYDAKFVRTQGY